MSEDTVRVLRCLLKGAAVPTKVSISVNSDIDDLKAAIHEQVKRSVLRNNDVQELFVWKVRAILRLEYHSQLGSSGSRNP
jgi:hypothetical protein